MMLGTTRETTCPICGHYPDFKLVESTVGPPKLWAPHRLEDGHEVVITTYHYNESGQLVSHWLSLPVVICCPYRSGGGE